MKIIDLLNKIANDEEVPKKIKFYGKYYIWYDNRYTGNEGYCLEPLKSDSNSFLEINTAYDLNNEVEILEEEKEQVKPLTKKDIEALGYACGEIQKCFTNGWTKSLENKPLEEEKKIPEKLLNNFHYTGGEEEIANKLNEIIDYLDYLKSKGE